MVVVDNGDDSKMMRIFMTGPLPDWAVRDLGKRYAVDVYRGRLPIPRDVLRSGLTGADGLVCYPFDSIDGEAMDWAPDLKVISTYSVGFDHIDVAAARRRGIAVGYTPDVLTEATADVAVALMLDLLRRVTEGDRIIRSGRWGGVYGAVDYLGCDMCGKTLGILGMGRIGSAVARRAAAFGMNVTYHNRNRLPYEREAETGATYVKFDQLISDSDVLSIHIPHTEHTNAIIDASVFERMKRSAVIINTARGRIVNEADLIRSLQDGKIAGAGLDVFENEPLERDSPLVDLQNVVLLPHIGSSTIETRMAMARLTIRNLDLGMHGKRPACSV